MEAAELSLIRWVRSGHVQLGPRGRGEKKFQPEGITSRGLRHDDIHKNTESWACSFPSAARGVPVSAGSPGVSFI